MGPSKRQIRNRRRRKPVGRQQEIRLHHVPVHGRLHQGLARPDQEHIRPPKPGRLGRIPRRKHAILLRRRHLLPRLRHRPLDGRLRPRLQRNGPRHRRGADPRLPLATGRLPLGDGPRPPRQGAPGPLGKRPVLQGPGHDEPDPHHRRPRGALAQVVFGAVGADAGGDPGGDCGCEEGVEDGCFRGFPCHV
ncbi:hypothetical protein CCUS01_11704 [Colletotrichum cuscutae]|uniref:Uncharacterized protein n=1 Tax=Colletotrichum cuscutae TaxID=1209917 RepID=A0AAI9TYH1_9PEZI|nr:hypothetical protein CCUS01_11704 [Colletotrichum cuscutae]